MRIAALILNYNGRKLLEGCLKSLSKQTKKIDIWLIDNNSTDDSVSWFKRNYRGSHVLKLEKNLGFVGGYNYAFKHLKKENYDFYFVLNNDTICGNNVVEEFISAAERYPNMTMFQPAIVDTNGIIDNCGGRLSLVTGR